MQVFILTLVLSFTPVQCFEDMSCTVGQTHKRPVDTVDNYWNSHMITQYPRPNFQVQKYAPEQQAAYPQ